MAANIRDSCLSLFQLEKVFFTVVAGLSLSVISLQAQAGWKPASAPLMTEWGARVTPENAWREYPRPQLVRAGWQNLNGLWDYALTATNASEPAQWNGKILVPYPIESALSGVGHLLEPTETLWYHRTLSVAERKNGERALLHFGGVDYDATVWVNGLLVGTNRGMNAWWTCDITEALAGKTAAEITVKVFDPTEGTQPRGKQSLKPAGCFYTRVSGIWQTVWLEIVPQNYITNLLPEPLSTLDGIDLTVSASQPDLSVTVKLLDGKKVVATATGKTGERLRLAVAHPKLWSPDSPFLYHVVATLDGGETVKGYAAIRWCERRQDAAGINRLFLNGKEIFQLGPLDQGWWPDGLLTPPSDTAMRSDLLFLKKAGFNGLRKHIKVENARYYFACDEIGLLVWQDFPCGFGMEKNEATRENFRREVKGIVEQLRVFPSIITWVVFNETWGQFDEAGTRAMVAWTKQTDPTRLVSNASGWQDYQCGDIVDAHRYPGPAMPALDPNRIAVLGEFGGQGLTIPGHMWQEKTWGYKASENPDALATRYQQFIDDLKPLKARGLSAAIYTQTTDVEIEKNGLLTYDRKVAKIPAKKLAAMNAQLFQIQPAVRVIAATSELAPVNWNITTNPPSADWNQNNFDDSNWTPAPGGFGHLPAKNSGPGRYVSGMGRVRTEWTGSGLWLRRTFEHDGSALAKPALVLYCDDAAEVWLNGQSLGQFTRNNAGSYTIIPLKNITLIAGTNLLAVAAKKSNSKASDQYLDAGLIDLGVQP